MDHKIEDLDHKMRNIKANLDFKERMTRFEYKFADSLFKSIKNSIDLEDESNFKQKFYDGEICKDIFSYDTILNFDFYKDDASQILSSRFSARLVVNELNEMLIDNNINSRDLSYNFDEDMFHELYKNKKKIFIDNKEEREVSIGVKCVLQFNYLPLPELLIHRIANSNLIQSLRGSLFEKKNNPYDYKLRERI